MQPLTIPVHKLSRTRAGRPYSQSHIWTSKNLTITPSGEILIAHRASQSTALPHLLIPGGACLAPHSTQLKYSRPHLLILTLILANTASLRSPRRSLLISAHSLDDATSIVTYATTASFRCFGDIPTPHLAPLLTVWGAYLELPPRHAAAIAAALGMRHSNLWRSENGMISSSHFTDAIINMATDLLTTCLNLSAFPMDNLALSQVLQVSPEIALEQLQSFGVEVCTPALLLSILFSPNNTAADPASVEKLHDMSLPLSQYLVASSHNTYLVGAQVFGVSAARMYRIVLEKRCRCLELDLWDGEYGVPVVTHGHTMTSKESLEGVLEVIADHSFSHGSDLPVILSLENHLCFEQQVVAAGMFRESFGDKLLLPDENTDTMPALPSLESLRGRILLKTKTNRDVFVTRTDGSTAERIEEYDNRDGSGEESGYSSSSSQEEDYDDDDVDVQSSFPTSMRRQIKSVVAPELSDVVYLSSGNRKKLLKMWSGGDSCIDTVPASTCVSLEERKISFAYEQVDPETLREYNSHALTRVYPKGTRVRSSNYTPTLAHYFGCQLVALNYQYCDDALAVNEARFEGNAGLGYILARSVREPGTPGVLQLTILSGFLLLGGLCNMTRKGDLYCVVKVYDAEFEEKEDFRALKMRTKAVRGNSFMPLWNEKLTLPVQNRSFAVMNLKVCNRDRSGGAELVGYCSVSTGLIREGLRCFPLKSKDGDPQIAPGSDLGPSILAWVKWT